MTNDFSTNTQNISIEKVLKNGIGNMRHPYTIMNLTLYIKINS